MMTRARWVALGLAALAATFWLGMRVGAPAGDERGGKRVIIERSTAAPAFPPAGCSQRLKNICAPASRSSLTSIRAGGSHVRGKRERSANSCPSSHTFTFAASRRPFMRFGRLKIRGLQIDQN